MTTLPRRADLLAQIATANAQARTRTLDASDADLFLRLARKAVRFARRHGLDPQTIEVVVDGGAVSNGYARKHFGAQTTEIRMQGGRVQVRRTHARSVPFGDNGRTTCKIRVPKDHPAKTQIRTRMHAGYAYLT